MVLLHAKKEQLIVDFFNIGKIENLKLKIDALEQHKEKLILLLVEESDTEIKNLINVIDALIILMLEHNKEKARKKIEYLWNTWKNQYTLSFYDIRLLNCILETSDTLENCIHFASNALNQLERFNDHEQYTTVKITLTYNLSYYLMEAKYVTSEKNIKLLTNSFSNYLSNLLDNLLDLCIKHKSFLLPKVLMKQGLLTKNKGLIYAGLSLINDDISKEKMKLIEDYDTYFINFQDLHILL